MIKANKELRETEFTEGELKAVIAACNTILDKAEKQSKVICKLLELIAGNSPLSYLKSAKEKLEKMYGNKTKS